jgi:hypothetical protein
MTQLYRLHAFVRSICETAKSDYQLHHVCLSVRINSSAPTAWIFMKFNTWVFFENLSRKFMFHLNLTRIMGTIHEVQYTFLIISHSVFLKMRKVTDKSCRENQNPHFMFRNFFQCHGIYEVVWKDIVELDRQQMTI